jgi:hypothetical protein
MKSRKIKQLEDVWTEQLDKLVREEFLEQGQMEEVSAPLNLFMWWGGYYE